MDVLNIAELLSTLGFTSDETRAAARQLLEDNKLTNPRKTFISVEKLARVQYLLLKQATRLCDNAECARLMTRVYAERPIIPVDTPNQCLICGGSTQRRAVRLLSAALQDTGVQRLLVVGGSPSAHQQIRQGLAGEPVEVRLVDGSTRGHSEREARSAVDWAQLMVVWSGTEMNHKASQVYTARCQVRQVLVPSPGLEALCRTVIAAVQPTGRRTRYG